MKNTNAISEASLQLKCVADHIGILSDAVDFAGQKELRSSFELYEEMRLQELEQAQKLVLLLTDLIAEESETEHADNAFFEGELTDNLGEKDDESVTVETKTGDEGDEKKDE